MRLLDRVLVGTTVWSCNELASLLKEIRNAAIRADEPLANVLRKCAVLGTQLNNDDLRDWAFQELNGYDKENVPDYRTVPAPLMGNFNGTFGVGFTNMAVPAIKSPRAAQRTGTDCVIRARCSWPGGASRRQR